MLSLNTPSLQLYMKNYFSAENEANQRLDEINQIIQTNLSLDKTKLIEILIKATPIQKTISQINEKIEILNLIQLLEDSLNHFFLKNQKKPLNENELKQLENAIYDAIEPVIKQKIQKLENIIVLLTYIQQITKKELREILTLITMSYPPKQY